MQLFLTKDDLKLSYGVDMAIGETYVNRRVPDHNLYWKDRKIYLPAAPGYIFMPIFTDILFRCGLPKDVVCSENQLLVQEKILHAAALFEYQKISWTDQVEAAKETVRETPKDIDLFNKLNLYLGQHAPIKQPEMTLGTAFPSLNRADCFLYSLVHLDPSTYNQTKALKGWYALMSYFLIMDDLADIREDLKRGEENVLTEAGMNVSGVEKVGSMLIESMTHMMDVNPVMGNRIDHKMSVIDLHAIVRSITS